MSTPPKQRAEYILVKHIRPYVVDWVEKYDAWYESGGIMQLSQAAEVSARVIYNIIHDERQTIEYNTADKICIALGKIDLLHEFTIYNKTNGNKFVKAPIPSRPPSQYYEE